MRKIIAKNTGQPPHWVGDGFPVRSLISHEANGLSISPFLLLDYAGPYNFSPKVGQPRGVGAHPHKGFETVTIVYDGEVEHYDSTGAGGVIGTGDVQWMTAGNGIIHQEFHSHEYTRKGGPFEMVQLWVNLPAANKSEPAGYQSITADMIPTVKAEDMSLRVIAGRYGETFGPARTFTPINVWDVKAAKGQTLNLPVPQDHNTVLVVLRGHVSLGGAVFSDASSVVLGAGSDPLVLDVLEDSTFLVLSGEPINEPVAAYGPFVMNTEDEIRTAIMDYNAGRFGRIAAH